VMPAAGLRRSAAGDHRGAMGSHIATLEPATPLLTMKRTLYPRRHAKSSWDDRTLSDRDRPLAPHGHRACELVAHHLRSHEITPELVLCSSSTRTQETLQKGLIPSRP
jgi:hypothetical protein